MSEHPPITDHERNHMLSDLAVSTVALRHAMASANLLLENMENKLKLMVHDAVEQQRGDAMEGIPPDLREFLKGLNISGAGFVLRRDA